jgi:hypothetical protein
MIIIKLPLQIDSSEEKQRVVTQAMVTVLSLLGTLQESLILCNLRLVVSVVGTDYQNGDIRK